MGKYEELETLYCIVKKILIEQEHTRSNLWELYYEVCKYVNPAAMSAKFGTVIRSHDEYYLPGFESISRTRRKVVHDFPDLEGCEEVEGGRWSYEKAFRKFARSKV